MGTTFDRRISSTGAKVCAVVLHTIVDEGCFIIRTSLHSCSEVGPCLIILFHGKVGSSYLRQSCSVIRSHLQVLGQDINSFCISLQCCIWK